MESISITTGSDFVRELKIINGATTRWGEKEERKRRGEKRKGRTALFCVGVTPIDMAQLMHESRRLIWCDWVDVAQRLPAWRGGHASTPWVTPVHIAWFLHKSCQPDWHDSKGSYLRDKFWSSSFLKFCLKKRQNKKNLTLDFIDWICHSGCKWPVAIPLAWFRWAWAALIFLRSLHTWAIHIFVVKATSNCFFIIFDRKGKPCCTELFN